MVFTRGRTAKKRLRIDWQTPVYAERQGGQTKATRLDWQGSIADLAKTDKRPLLVMRECHLCEGTDFALLRRATQNERTMMLTRWFHCVKLPATVTEKRHPYHALFEGKKPPHLFFTTTDGSDKVTLPGNQSQTALWAGMTKILRKSYKKNPNSALKSLMRLLEDFDALDAKESAMRRQLDKTLEDRGPKSAKFKSLKKRFEGLQVKRKKLLDRERKLLDLKFR